MKKPILLMLAAVLSLSMSLARAQEDHAYTFGGVVVSSYVRTQPGMFEEYLRYLSTTYKRVLDEAKKQGIIVDYAVYSVTPRDGEDADLILTVKYKNMAAFDTLQARMDPIVKQVFGSLPKAATASADREKLRKDAGGRLLRELILK